MDLTDRLIDSLDTSIGLIHRLEKVMLAETQAIASQAPEALQEVVTQKLDLVKALEAETLRQKGWVEEAGFGFTPEGIGQLIAAQAGDARLTDRWDELRLCSGRCDQLNEENARLIQRDRKRIAMALRILSGDGAAATYDPHGRPKSVREQSRSISQA